MDLLHFNDRHFGGPELGQLACKKWGRRRAPVVLKSLEIQKMEEIQLSCLIVLPAPLRDCAGGRSSLEATGDTVGALLREVGVEYGPLVDRILGPDGGLRSSVNVYLNE